MSCIYSILNKSNGKIYIGQTIQKPNKRKSEHFTRLRRNEHDNPHLQNAFNKYGEDSFEFNIIENCSIDKLNDNEEWWIDYFNSTNPDIGYNLQSGGDSNYTVSEETRKKQSEALKGYKHSIESRINMSNARKGIVFSDEHKKNISKSKSKAKNTTGFYRVFKDKDSRYSQGFRYVYKWTENGSKKKLTSVSLDKLQKKVIANGLLWCEISKLDEALSNG